MDLVILLLLIGLVIFFFRRFSSLIYLIGIVDIFLRLVTFIKVELTKGELYAIIDKYIPFNIPTLLGNYSDGLLYTILLWLYIAAMIIFEFYLIKGFFKKL